MERLATGTIHSRLAIGHDYGSGHVDTRLVRYAIEVGRQRSFTKAAARLHIAQPSLSQQIAKLEQELGLPLFHRTHHAVIPTPDGLRFLELGERIVGLQEDLVREMQERRAGIGGELTVGTPTITGEHVLPPLLENFQMRHPRVRVRIVEDTPLALERATVTGSTDLAILPLPVEDANLSAQPILTEPILLALPAEWGPWMSEWQCALLVEEDVPDPLAHSSVPLSTVSRAPFILLKAGYGFRQTVRELCAGAGFQPHIAYETSSVEMAQSLVGHGLGVTLVPAMVKRPRGAKAPRYYELAERPSRTLAFVYRRDRYLSLTAREFLSMAAGAAAYGQHLPESPK